MKALLFSIFLLTISSCASKKYIEIRQLPKGISSASEELYVVENDQKKLIHKKQMTFTRNGRIKSSKTVDSLGNLIQETEKKLWFVVESYPDKENYYCKTRWKTNNRERISCYTQKQYKKNESIYHYNKNGTIDKIVDNFTTFNTQYFYYSNNELSKIITKDKNDIPIEECLISCASKDEKGACLKEIRNFAISNKKEEIYFFPIYD